MQRCKWVTENQIVVFSFLAFSSSHSSCWPSLCFAFIFNWKRWLNRLLYMMSSGPRVIVYQSWILIHGSAAVYLCHRVPFAPSALSVFWTSDGKKKTMDIQMCVHSTIKNAWESIFNVPVLICGSYPFRDRAADLSELQDEDSAPSASLPCWNLSFVEPTKLDVFLRLAWPGTVSLPTPESPRKSAKGQREKVCVVKIREVIDWLFIHCWYRIESI